MKNEPQIRINNKKQKTKTKTKKLNANVVPAMNFSVATISSFDAMPGSALELIGPTVSIDGPIGPTITGLLAAHFV